jgi:hypothetical protein
MRILSPEQKVKVLTLYFTYLTKYKPNAVFVAIFFTDAKYWYYLLFLYSKELRFLSPLVMERYYATIYNFLKICGFCRFFSEIS